MELVKTAKGGEFLERAQGLLEEGIGEGGREKEAEGEQQGRPDGVDNLPADLFGVIVAARGLVKRVN